MGATHCGPLDGGGAYGACRFWGGVLLGLGGWLDAASCDSAELVQRVNNPCIWISLRVVLGWCSSAALRLIGGRISAVFYFRNRCALQVLFFLVWRIAVSVVSPAVVLAAKFRAGFNIQYLVICIYLYVE